MTLSSVHDLKPYPAYRDSGVSWLGPVPEHWDVRSLGSLVTAVSARGRPDLPLLSVVREKGVIPRATMSDGENHNFVPDDLSNYKVARAGDLVINKMKAWQGSLGIAPINGIVSPAYYVYDFGIGDRRFGEALLRSKTYAACLARASDGVRIGQWELSVDGVKRIPVAVPPVAEQSAIVRFLDHVDRSVRRYVRAKQRLIALLNEERQAIIHRAVTRGLNPSVLPKPSGVEWLGDVPEHWEVLPIKRAFVSMDYGISECATDAGTIRLLTMGNIRDGRVTVPYDGGVGSVDPRLLLEPNDLLFNRTNSAELVGKVGLYRGSAEQVTFASYLVRLRPRRDCDAEYLNYVLNDGSLLSAVRREAIPSLHQSNLNPTRYGRLKIALPPLPEQVDIVRFVFEATAAPTSAIDGAKREVDLLCEYRARLVADIVTGKLDVRDAAARLPDESEAPEQIEEGESVAAEDEVDADAGLVGAAEEDEG